MKKPTTLPPAAALLLLLVVIASPLASVSATGTADGSEEWGYVEVRPKAHMFWWLYRSPRRVTSASTPWPVVLWLQGGPGASGVGIGNFQEIGPLDTKLSPRNSTWLQKADLLFVDNPVGSGFSYVEDTTLLVKTDWEAAADLTALLKVLFNGKESKLRGRSLYVIAESYGGKYAVTLGLSIVKAVNAGELGLKFEGVALGDSWISPEDYVFSWGPFLKDLSRLDDNGVQASNSLAEKIKQQLQNGQYTAATDTWDALETVIGKYSNDVDFYNFMLDSNMDPLAITTATLSSTNQIAAMRTRYSTYLSAKQASSKPGANGDDLKSLMDGAVREKLGIIPKDVRWGNQSGHVFDALSGDFMKPRIDEVDQLLAAGVNVTIYNGQLDVICGTKGTEAWLQNLKWEGLHSFNSLNRTLCTVDRGAPRRSTSLTKISTSTGF